MATITNSSGIDWNDVDGLTVDLGASLRFLAVRSFDLSAAIRGGVGNMTNVGGVRKVTFNDLSEVVFTGTNPAILFGITINTMNFTNGPNPGDNMTVAGSFTGGPGGINDGILTSGTNIVGGQKFTVTGNLSISDGDDPDPLYATAGTISKMTITAGIYTVALTGAITAVGGSAGTDPAFNGTVSSITIQQTGSATILFSATGLAANNAGDLLNNNGYGSLGDFVAAVFAGNGLNDTFTGGAGNDTLNGGTGNDSLAGLGGLDVLDAGDGNDSVSGGAGDDSLVGGTGTDVASYAGLLGGYSFSVANGTLTVHDFVPANGSDGTDSLSQIEKLQFSNALLSFATSSAFQVNTITVGDQTGAAIAALPSGGFVVSWESWTPDGSDSLVYAQRYGADGVAAGAQFQVNTYTTEFQFGSAIAGLAGDGFVVAWISQGQDGDSSGIYARRYGASGAAAGPEFRVNTITAGPQTDPSIATLADGGFVVTWESNVFDGSNENIHAQRYSAGGIAAGAEFQVNTYTTSDQSAPTIAALAGGGFVVSWSSFEQDGSDHGVYAQRYNAAGAAAGVEFRVNTSTTGPQTEPAIAALAGGGFVVSWTSGTSGGFLQDIFAQRYDASGVAAGTEFQVNAFTAGNQSLASVASLGGGGFVVVWNSFNPFDGNQPGDHDGIFAQRYDADGAAAGAEFQINTTPESIGPHTVTALADGGFLVSWPIQDQSSLFLDVYSRRFDANGNPVALLTGAAGADVINLAAGEILRVNGADGNDTVNGSSGDDALLGGAGNDSLFGDDGDDSLLGGLGSDTFSIDLGDVVTEAAGAAGGTADLVNVFLLNGQTYALPANVEKLSLFEEEGTITGIGNPLANLITGSTTSNNSLLGGGGNDTLVGSSLNDTLEGAAGADNLQGGGGNDRYHVDLTAVAAAMLSDTIADTGGTDSLFVFGVAGPTSFTYAMLGAIDHIDVSDVDNAVNISITGNALGNSMVGHDGNDTFKGEAGNDTFIGFHGNNSFDGGLGDDEYQNSYGNDTFRISQAGDSIVNSAEGQDGVATVVVTLAGNQYLDISDDPNLDNVTFEGATGVAITGNSNIDLGNVLTGGTGNDTIGGGDGADTLNGGAGNDSLNGGPGIDSVAGGAGNDTIRVDHDLDLVSDTTGIDTVMVEAVVTFDLGVNAAFENLILTGGVAKSGIGNALGNVLTSADGNHTLVGGLGNDTFHVQAGDTVEDGEGAAAGGIDLAIALLSGAEIFTIGENVDNLTLLSVGFGAHIGIGNNIANRITGTNTSDDSLVGNEGNDTLIGWTGNATIAGGHDSLAGGEGNDSLDGGGGIDYLDGGDGADMLNGGTGDDVYRSNLIRPLTTVMLDDTITDAAGTDTLFVSAAFGVINTTTFKLTLAAALENLNLSGVEGSEIDADGNASNNFITGNAHANILSSLGGNDTITGMGGGDTLNGGDGNDYLSSGGYGSLAGGLGNDTFDIGGINDAISDAGGIDIVQILEEGYDPYILPAGFENLSFLDGATDNTGTGNALANLIASGDGNDGLGGGDGNDTLEGGNGTDTLSGNDGSDLLDGGTGADSMAGEAGNDTFMVDNAGDTVSDMEAGTDLVMSSVSFTLSDPDLENLTLIGENSITGIGNALGNVLTSQSSEGNQTMIGLAGNDTFNVFFGDLAQESQEGDGAADLVVATLFDEQSYTLGNFLENLTLLHFAEGTITGTGNAEANTITGTATSDDSLSGLASGDSLVGNAGHDSLDGGTENDTLLGGDGNDVLDGGGWDNTTDSMAGGLGNDTYNLFLANEGGGLDDTFDTVTETIASGADMLVFSSEGATSGTLTIALAGDLANFEHLDFSGMETPVAITATGNATGNSIAGHAGQDILNGGLGNDTINGLGGADSVDGGEGDDRFISDGSGALVIGGAGSDTVVFTGPTLDGAVWLDSLVLANLPGIFFAENLELQGGAVSFGFGDGAANVLRSVDGVHGLVGGQGNDTFHVQAGDNVQDGVANIILGGGSDLVIATLADGDSFTLHPSGDVEDLTLLHDGEGTIGGHGNLAANRITGATTAGANNSLTGGDGNDTLVGSNLGNDTLQGGNAADNDSMAGGLGNDWYYAPLVKPATTVMLEDTIIDTGGIDRLVISASIIGENYEYVLPTLFEELDIGGVIAVAVHAKGNAANNQIFGGTQDNRLKGEGGNDTLSGLSGNDTLDGGLGSDSYLTSDGDDTYIVDATDTFNVVGGIDDNIDTLRLTSNLSAFRNIDAHDYFENLVFVGTGNVALTGNQLINQLTGGAGADTLDGGEGGDLLTSGAGNDSLDGADELGPFNDSLVGGLGNDTYRVDISTDLITEAALAGTDTVLSNANFYQLLANIENLTILGGGEGTGVGNSGANIILGDSSHNWISGNGGNDTLTGSAGNDTFIFETPETAPLAGSYARITDFSRTDDVMALEESLFDGLINGGVFAGGGLIVTLGTAAVGIDAQLVYTPGTGALYYDSDGTGVLAKVQIAAFTTTKPATLDATDFTVFTGYV